MPTQSFSAHRRRTIRGWRALVLGLMATLFALSGVARAATPPNGTPPCHMAAGGMMASGSPAKAPAKAPADMMAMNCCVGCLPTTAGPLVISETGRPSRPVAFERWEDLRDGLARAPELGPPRTA